MTKVFHNTIWKEDLLFCWVFFVVSHWILIIHLSVGGLRKENVRVLDNFQDNENIYQISQRQKKQNIIIKY